MLISTWSNLLLVCRYSLKAARACWKWHFQLLPTVPCFLSMLQARVVQIAPASASTRVYSRSRHDIHAFRVCCLLNHRLVSADCAISAFSAFLSFLHLLCFMSSSPTMLTTNADQTRPRSIVWCNSWFYVLAACQCLLFGLNPICKVLKLGKFRHKLPHLSSFLRE